MPSARKRERNRLEAEIQSSTPSTKALDMLDYLDSGKEPQIVCETPPFIDARTVQEAMDLTSVKEVMDQ